MRSVEGRAGMPIKTASWHSQEERERAMFCCVSDPALAVFLAGEPEEQAKPEVTAAPMMVLMAGYLALIASFFVPLILR